MRFTCNLSNTGTEFSRNPFSIFHRELWFLPPPSPEHTIIGSWVSCNTVMPWSIPWAPRDCALPRVTMAKDVQACHIWLSTCASWHTVRDWLLPSVTCDTKVRFCPVLPDTQKISVFRGIVLCRKKIPVYLLYKTATCFGCTCCQRE